MSTQPAPSPLSAPLRQTLNWRDRWLLWRNRQLASPGFQQRAARFVLTRPVARQRAGQLFDLVAGFVYSQVLLACVRLRLFDRLHDAPEDAAALAAQLDMEPHAMTRLLQAGCALRLLQRFSDGRYGLGVLGAPMVGNAALAAMVEHHAVLYADLSDPVALLRGQAGAQQLAGYWPYGGTTAPEQLAGDRVAPYSALMTASQPLVASEILDSHDFRAHRRLLDVGGGEGRFLMAAAQRAPELALALFDLPAVAQRAQVALDAAGLAARARAHGGDFFNDPLPYGADLITLVRVVHDHNDGPVSRLLRAAHTALVPGGTLLLAEPMAGTASARAMGDAYFGFYLLAMGHGQPRTGQRLTELLQQAGFAEVRLLANAMPLQTSLLLARKGRT
ncbi:MAG: methyltransferase [Hydrogenophaga sp.]|nr:methyltransferase [Hydrogenophaga sp.]